MSKQQDHLITIKTIHSEVRKLKALLNKLEDAIIQLKISFDKTTEEEDRWKQLERTHK